MADGTTLGGWLSCLFVAAGCNAIFGLDAGKPRPAGSAGSAGKAGAASGTSGRGGSGNAGSGGDSGEGGEVNAGKGGGAGKAGAGGAVGGSAGTGGGTGGASAGAGGSGGTGGASGGEAGTAGTATDGGEGGQPADPRPVASVWALWKMPNPAGSGLPNEASYDTSTPGIVLDNVTQLIWQRVPGAPRNWDDAVSYCSDLELAGFDDWRVPSRIELVSIVDFTVGPPTIDPVAFPDTPEELFWTTSPWPSDPTAVYIVHFIGGYTSVSDRMATRTQRVRCVR